MGGKKRGTKKNRKEKQEEDEEEEKRDGFKQIEEAGNVEVEVPKVLEETKKEEKEFAQAAKEESKIEKAGDKKAASLKKKMQEAHILESDPVIEAKEDSPGGIEELGHHDHKHLEHDPDHIDHLDLPAEEFDDDEEFE